MKLVIVGAGIIGLASARAALQADPTVDVTIVEKEVDVAQHQTSHNSGVVHAGLYYKPGSLKARLCRRGVGLMRAYCQEHSLPYEECGKVLVATTELEVGRLADIEERAAANGVPNVTRLSETDLRIIEPNVSGLGGLHSPTTAIVDFARVAHTIKAELEGLGATVRLAAPVARVRDDAAHPEVHLQDGGILVADRVLVCAGLHVDQLARASGRDGDPRIIPFRGEYYELRPDRRNLVRGLIYPVPDPALPFLGVHLTKSIDGSVLVGPNAVLALAREGYRRTDFSPADVKDIVSWSGMRRVARAHWRVSLAEVARSTSRTAFVREARRYVPALRSADVTRAKAGVRAQAVAADGTLVDDFELDHARNVVWVRNAPSPAATSSMAIAEELVERVRSAG